MGESSGRGVTPLWRPMAPCETLSGLSHTARGVTEGDARDSRETAIRERSIGCQHRPLSMVLQAIANTDMNEVFKCA